MFGGAIPIVLFLLFALIYDLLTTVTDWHRVFRKKQWLPIPPLPRRHANGEQTSTINISAPLNCLQIPLGSYLRYKWTLRLDYAIGSSRIMFVHLIRKLLIWCGLMRHPTPDYSRQIVRMLMDSSLMVGLQSLEDHGFKKTATFMYRDFHLPGPYRPGHPTGVLRVDSLIITLQLTEGVEYGTFVRTLLNDSEVSASDTVVLLDLTLKSPLHTAIHAFAPFAFDLDFIRNPLNSSPRLRQMLPLSLITFFVTCIAGLNYAANFWPAPTFTMTSDSLGAMFHHNLNLKRLPWHGHGRAAVLLASYSPVARFLLAARRATLEVLRDERLDGRGVNAECFFLASVVHSMDHYTESLTLDPVCMQGSGGWRKIASSAEWCCVLFTSPNPSLFADTRMMSCRLPWARRLYARLVDINPVLARAVHMCISS